MKGVARHVAVVTGGAKGIGAATARRLESGGHHVFIWDLDGPAASEVAANLAHASAIRFDASDPASIRSLFDAVNAQFGRCDILVNNAGIAHPGAFEDYPVHRWQQVMAVNLNGPMLACQKALRLMKQRAWGWIVNITSIGGDRASVYRAAYGTPKAVLGALTRQIATSWPAQGLPQAVSLPGLSIPPSSARIILPIRGRSPCARFPPGAMAKRMRSRKRWRFCAVNIRRTSRVRRSRSMAAFWRQACSEAWLPVTRTPPAKTPVTAVSGWDSRGDGPRNWDTSPPAPGPAGLILGKASAHRPAAAAGPVRARSHRSGAAWC